MLKLTNITKTFNPGTITEKKVLRGIDLELDDGDFVTVIGGNGAESGELSGVVPGDTAFAWDGKNWKVRSVQYTGAYNDKKTYQITAIRNHAFPSAS